MASVLARWEYAAVFVSPLQRARETCDLAGYGAVAQATDDLVEWDYGDYEGLTAAEICDGRPGWVIWRDGVPGGETLEDVAERAERVIATVNGISGNVLLISHGHLLRILAARWLELPAVAGQRFFLGTARPSELGYEHDWTVVRAWNLDSGA